MNLEKLATYEKLKLQLHMSRKYSVEVRTIPVNTLVIAVTDWNKALSEPYVELHPIVRNIKCSYEFTSFDEFQVWAEEILKETFSNQ